MPSKTFDAAIAKAQQLPAADQERLGRELNDYIDHLRALRSDVEAGVRSVEAGRAKALDIEAVLVRARSMHAGDRA